MIKRYFLFFVAAVFLHLLIYFCLTSNIKREVEPEKNSKTEITTFRMVDLPKQKISSPAKKKVIVPKANATPKKQNHMPQAAESIEHKQPDEQTEQTDSATEEVNIENSAAESTGENEKFFNAAEVSVLPSLPTRVLRQRLHYPKEARQRGIEGIVYLQLYINSKGVVEKVEILHEKPDSSYGFGMAAKNALLGIKGTPAKYNGNAVGVIFRYPVRFTLEK